MIRVVIVDDHALVRAGLRQYLSEHVDLRVVAECANAAELMVVVQQAIADVVLLDISMPGQSGVEALRAVKECSPQLAVLMLSTFPEAYYATALLRQGASGYLGKDCDAEEIVRAIRTVARGRRYITPGVAQRLAGQLVTESGKAPHELLSERELQVFMQLAGGLTISRIADVMALSVKTISTFRGRLMDKMGLASNSDLTYYAVKNDLIQ